MSRALEERRSKRKTGAGKAERFIQPSILMSLKRKPSYGYEIIRNLPEFGFVEGPAPPGMIYRHLRDLEASGLVTSEWETEGAGPAKRVYDLTSEGEAALALWAEYMQEQAQKLTNFFRTYRKIEKAPGRRCAKRQGPVAE